MAIKDRIQRHKEYTRQSILNAARQIVTKQGWGALSMRKVAAEIEYRAPIIYAHFKDKDEMIGELTSMGFATLKKQMLAAIQTQADLARQIEAMWIAYWDFAFAERELYQAMFGVELNCYGKDCTGIDGLFELFKDAIVNPNHEITMADDLIYIRFYSCWTAIHGLISLNLLRKIIVSQHKLITVRSNIISQTILLIDTPSPHFRPT
jgi:AcrR family transcriptional regulator